MAEAHSDTFHHVRDFEYFDFPFGYRYWLPKWDLPLIGEFQLTKFMVLQVVAGLLILFIFWGLSRHIRSGKPARGAWWNFWELLALYIRDEVVRPTIGTGHSHHDHDSHGAHGDSHHAGGEYADHGFHGQGMEMDPPYGAHPADKYLPFVWTAFFYVLFCNLLGAVPFLGSATGNINVTGALALCVFGLVLIAGAQASGAVGFWKSLVPPMDVPGPVGILLVPMIWVIEVFGLLVKHFVLAVRLFANIMGGHTVIGVILGFIAVPVVLNSWLFYVVTPASVLGQVGIGLLELLVAFIQAYIFAFLSTLFISMAVHPH